MVIGRLGGFRKGEGVKGMWVDMSSLTYLVIKLSLFIHSTIYLSTANRKLRHVHCIACEDPKRLKCVFSDLLLFLLNVIGYLMT